MSRASFSISPSAVVVFNDLHREARARGINLTGVKIIVHGDFAGDQIDS